MFERYVNFEFYKTSKAATCLTSKFERYVNFEFYKTWIQNVMCRKGLRDM